MTAPKTRQSIQPKPQKINFEKTIQDAVDETFSLLGENSKKTIYQHLENDYKITKHEIPCKIEAFADALEQSFGVGAKILEMNIIKALHERNQEFMYVPKKRDVMFTDYVASLQCFMASQAQ
ncbi:hypothetical protein G4O51_03800 [Candidatus Bathyarchaeota archaeon A05DMB-2]|jgi:hypothetical protein|nr:hypothetical protein [Candidatus Bathyarchaeota archaeon A05DMB-2]